MYILIVVDVSEWEREREREGGREGGRVCVKKKRTVVGVGPPPLWVGPTPPHVCLFIVRFQQ